MTENQKDMKDLQSTCQICGENLLINVVMFGKPKKVKCICSCRKKEIELENQKFKQQEEKRKLEEIRRFSLMDSDFQEKTFDNYIIDHYNKDLYTISKNYCSKWDEMKKENTGILFYGIPGIGKTFATACIANELISKGVNVICIRLDSIVSRIYDSYGRKDDYTESDILNRVNAASLLILDDVGTEHTSKSEKEKQIIYSLVDARLRSGKPTICTTNLDLALLKEKLTGYDGVSRTYDRLIEMCTPIKVKGESKRIIRTKNRREEVLKKLLE